VAKKVLPNKLASYAALVPPTTARVLGATQRASAWLHLWLWLQTRPERAMLVEREWLATDGFALSAMRAETLRRFLHPKPGDEESDLQNAAHALHDSIQFLSRLLRRLPPQVCRSPYFEVPMVSSTSFGLF
jgi:hypothetical protein